MFKEVALNNLQKQFGYTNVSDLIIKRSEVWDKYLGNISQRFTNEIMNIETCTSEALDNYWGKIFKISRNFYDANNNIMTLTDEQFRKILKIRAFGLTWQGDIKSVNAFLRNIYDGICYLRDNQDMTQTYVFYFPLESWERYLFTYKDILPRPAAVKTKIYEITDDLFGFDGSDFQPFDAAPFYE